LQPDLEDVDQQITRRLGPNKGIAEGFQTLQRGVRDLMLRQASPVKGRPAAS